jgi:hypothetical protein
MFVSACLDWLSNGGGGGVYIVNKHTAWEFFI